MSALKNLRVAHLDEVVIQRSDIFAFVGFKEPDRPCMRLQIGEDVHRMTDAEILDAFNQTVRSMQESADKNPPVEIADGYPQIRFDRNFNHWSPVGDVLRCEIVDGDYGQVALQIDDKVLTMDEFTAMISPYRGWGMRIMFVSDCELVDPPTPIVCKRRPKLKEPDNVPPYPTAITKE